MNYDNGSAINSRGHLTEGEEGVCMHTHLCVYVNEWMPSYYSFVAYLCVVPSLSQDSQLATVSTLTHVSKFGPPSPP